MIGIMQGRLTNSSQNFDLDWFPFESWEKEFYAAAQLGYDNIELVLDKHCDARNPLLNNNSLEKLKYISSESKVKTVSCCINSIISQGIANKNEIRKIKDILRKSEYLGINKIVLPLFDVSEPSRENLARLIKVISEIAIEADELRILVLIESNMVRHEAERFFEYLKFKRNIGMVYDLGNMTHCGYDVAGDIDYFKDLIKLVHIKDKDKNGCNVRLGTGGVDFTYFLRKLVNNKYTFGYTLETARGVDALAEAEINLRYMTNVMSKI